MALAFHWGRISSQLYGAAPCHQKTQYSRCQYLSEEGEQCPLKAAVFCSNPWNLEVCHKALIRTTLGAEVYSATMGRNMQALFDMQVMRIAQGRVLTNRHSEQILKNPGVDEAKARGGKYLHEFDR